MTGDRDRTRTSSWGDPARSAARAAELSGLDFLRGILRGEIAPAPVGTLLDIALVDVDEGRAVFTLDPAEFQFNPIGSVHGGVLATVCDSALGCAVQSTLPAGVAYTTLELHVNFVRPVLADTGTLHCTGRIVHVGRRTATAEARLEGPDGRLYAHATATCLILR